MLSYRKNVNTCIMAKVSAAQFVRDVSVNESLQEKLKSATDLESFVEIAEQCGYCFTLGELQTVIEEDQSGRMSHEQLSVSPLFAAGYSETPLFYQVGYGDCGECEDGC